jgi:broad specificity phosphatase PhoE
LTPEQVHETAPRWLIFRDGCSGGETPEQVGGRADRVIARARMAEDDVALFAHGHILRVLGARWIGLPAGAGQHFLLDTGTLCVLGYYRDITAVKIWNGASRRLARDEIGLENNDAWTRICYGDRSYTRTRPTAPSPICQRFELLSSGLNSRKFRESIFSFMTSRRNRPITRVDSAVTTPGAVTSTA